MRIAIVSVGIVLLTACGRSLPNTVEDAYRDIAEVYCVPLVDCDEYAGSEDRCVDELVDAFCTQGVNCAADFEEVFNDDFTRGEWNDCLSDIEDLTCSGINDQPSSCDGI